MAYTGTPFAHFVQRAPRNLSYITDRADSVDLTQSEFTFPAHTCPAHPLEVRVRRRSPLLGLPKRMSPNALRATTSTPATTSPARRSSCATMCRDRRKRRAPAWCSHDGGG